MLARYKDRIDKLQLKIDQGHENYQKLLEECRQKDVRIEELEADREFSGRFAHKYCNKILEVALKFDKQFKLQLNLQNQMHRELFEVISYARLPDIKNIYIDYLK